MVVMSELAVAVEGPAISTASADAVAGTNRPALARRAPPRSKPARWCSSLGQEDLSTLLSVIENQLLPQLLADYTPAKQSPLGPPIKRRR